MTKIKITSRPAFIADINTLDPLAASICLADSEDLLPPPTPGPRINIICNDADTDHELVSCPKLAQAKSILAFVEAHRDAPRLFIQCTMGVGRSKACAAALMRIAGNENGDLRIRQAGTYNRTLYDRLLEAAGVEGPVEPLVVIAVRLKYDYDRAELFARSMQRQRYRNWMCVFVSDGKISGSDRCQRFIGSMYEEDHRFRLFETEEAKGHWGHPYRQFGIDQAKDFGAEIIGLSNDDNYYVPGYIEQMVYALESSGTDLAVCDCLHSYQGWAVQEACPDLGSWLARRSLIERVKWEGIDQEADTRFFRSMMAEAGAWKVCRVKRPLFVKN